MTKQVKEALLSRPLYAQVRQRLVERLIEGSWQPGQIIPSEMQLAQELGVSQGTVRKALDAMTSENLLVRKQGRGTFVAELEENQILFRFFRLVPDGGKSIFPKSEVLSMQRGRATRDEAVRLGLAAKDSVWRIERLRTLGERPLLVETIILPLARFPDFGAVSEVPNNVYALYSSQFGITIGSATEHLKAIAARADDARLLGCAEETPLLQISRVALDLARLPVELRLSRCRTDLVHYESHLS